MPRLLKERILSLESPKEYFLSLKYVDKGLDPPTAILYLNKMGRVFLTHGMHTQGEGNVRMVRTCIRKHVSAYARR